MSRKSFVSLVGTIAAAALSVNAVQARPIFIKFDGIDGECTSSGNMVQTFVGGQPVVQWHTPAGAGTLVFSPSSENQDRPIESLSLNFTKITFNTVPAGSNVGVADDVWVDGRIITAAVWARWTKVAGDGIQIDFGRSPQIDGDLEVIVKRGGVPVGRRVCVGSLAACWFLTVTCPDLECSILCPSLCGVPSSSRPDGDGGVAIDLPLGNLVTFDIPGQPALTGDEISVVLRPSAQQPPMSLAGTRLSVEGLPGLQINSARGEFGCPADFNDSGSLSVQDIFDFLAKFFANSPEADFNSSGSLSVQDLFDFLAAYFRGC